MILLLVDTPCAARPRRRFCEFYPYAPRCLGVAAKRSPSRSDIYQSLINRVLAEAVGENFSKEPVLTSTQPEMYGEKAATLSKLANLVLAAERKHDARNKFSDTADSWSQQFEDYENERGV